jgi:hypothetical protein
VERPITYNGAARAGHAAAAEFVVLLVFIATIE